MRLEPVTRLRREQVGEDRYDDPTYEEAAAPLPPALFAPAGRDEPVGVGREPVVHEPTLYWPRREVDVIASDRLVVRGRVFSIIGDPAIWRGRRAGGTAVKLKAIRERKA